MMTYNGNLPFEVITLILLKLSVKSLLRFKCVCKTFCALIKNPHFISDHLKSRDDKDTRLVVSYPYSNTSRPFKYALFVDKTLTDLSYQDLDSQMPIHGFLFGPFDGLFGVYQLDSHIIYLWNIATRETRILPECRTAIPRNTRFVCHFGYGYAPLSNDYKLVILRQILDDFFDYLDSHVSLYSLNDDCWRDLQVPELKRHISLEWPPRNSYLNGVYYWLARELEDYKQVIVTFDMTSEKFQEITPHFASEDSTLGVLEVVDDTLCLLERHHNIKDEISIWMMREGCWTKRLTTSLEFIGGAALAFWKNDNIFLGHIMNREQLILYDLNNQEAKDLGIPWLGVAIKRYNESLVSIKRENDLTYDVFDIPWHVLGVY